MAAETGICLVLATAAFIFYMCGLEMNKRHVGPKLLFFLMSLWTVVLSLNIAYNLAIGDSLSANIQSGLNTAVGVSVAIALFISGYFVVVYATDIMINIGWVKSKHKLQNFLIEDDGDDGLGED